MRFAPGFFARLLTGARWELRTGKDAPTGYIRLGEDRIPLTRITSVWYQPRGMWGEISIEGVNVRLNGISTALGQRMRTVLVSAVADWLRQSFEEQSEGL